MSTITESPWRTTTEVLEYFQIARKTLSRRMDRFSYGHHYYRKDPGNKRSEIVWHLANLEKFFTTPVASRINKRK
jgi:hypothetical protein